MDRFFASDAFSKLPWYVTRREWFAQCRIKQRKETGGDEALRGLLIHGQAEDGYVGDHVAATFHMAHYFRLMGQPTPKASQMVARVLRDQKPDGG
jgi:hypothetical protein